MSFSVRAATPDDAPRLVDLLSELGYTVSAGDVERGRRQPGSVVLVAEVGATVIGLLAMQVRWHFQRAANVASIDALVVAGAHRSAGAGRALVRAALDAAAEAGAVGVDLNSHVDRTDARRFYERLGFEAVSLHFWRPQTPQRASPKR